MTRPISRRDAFRLGGLGLTTGALSTLLGRSARAEQYQQAEPQCLGDPKLLVINLRGGNDGINTVIPYQDPDYYSERPTIAIPSSGTGAGIVLNNFAMLNPALQPLMNPWNKGKVAFLHRIGDADSTLSHFTEQHFWETAVPGDLTFAEGWVPRLVSRGGFGPAAGNSYAASVSPRIQLLFDTQDPANQQAHIPLINDRGTYKGYSIAENTGSPSPEELKIRGDTASAGLRDFVAPPASSTPAEFDALQRGNYAEMLQSEDLVAPLIGAPWTGPGGGQYPQPGVNGLPNKFYVTQFGDQLRDSMHMLVETDLRIAGVEIGGWDTHSNQSLQQQERLQVLAAGLRAAFDDAEMAYSANILIFVMTEFGRTSGENGSNGTDHGRGGLAIAIGRCVKKGVYNNFTGAKGWTNGAGDGTRQSTLFDDGKYMPARTEYRTVFAEILRKHFLLSGGAGGDIDHVIPGWHAESQAGGPLYTSLGFLR